MSKLTVCLLLIIMAISGKSDSSPLIGFEQLMISAEENPTVVINARVEAVRQNLPVSIMTKDNVIAEVKSIESGIPVYAVITDLKDIYNGSFTAFFYELRSRIDLSNARIDYGNGRVVDNTGGQFNPKFGDRTGVSKVLLVTDWTADRVYMYNSTNGDLIDTAFIPRSSPLLQSPRHALQHPNTTDILVSDQLSDVVQRFNRNGTYEGVFAPIGGPITSILDNIRGMSFRAGNNLLVTVGGGTNQNTVQQFDSAGNHLGTFLPTTNLNSPFFVTLRGSDMLVSNFSGTNRVSSFDLSGNFISYFYVGSSFAGPQQIHELPNGNVLVAAFSIPSGIAYLSPTGTFIRLINASITGNRSAYLLGNGNYLTTNGAGVHEIDSASGNLVRTVTAGANFQFISELPISQPEFRVNMKFQAINAQDTITVELRNSTSPYTLVESRKTLAGQGLPAVVNFTSITNGTPYYIVLKHRNSIETWSSTPRTFNSDYMRYDFTPSPTQAFGNNMYDLIGSMALFTGDVNQDGTVDGSDAGLIDNDAFGFVSGYVSTDLNYDDIVDATDASLADNNAFNFVGVVRP